MTMFRILLTDEQYIDIEADNIEMSPTGLVLTRSVESLNPLDPIDKTALCGLFKNIVGVYAIDPDTGERIDLIR